MENQHENNLMKPPSWKDQNYFPARYFISLMAFLGSVFVNIGSVSINFTIQAMVKPIGNNINSTDDGNDVCNFSSSDSGAGTIDYGGDFEWDEVIQGLVIGAWYWGSIWTQIPGGRLAELYGAKILLGTCIGISGLLTLLVPLAAHLSYIALIIVRILKGLAEGPLYPIGLVLVSSWAPPNERSMLTAIVCAGDAFGTIIAYPISAAIVNALGWEAVFYILGSLTLIWCALWFLLSSDDPETFRYITDAEKKYIASVIGDSKSRKSPPIPLRSIITSMPFWAIVVVGLGDIWGWQILLDDLPLYMKEMLKMDMTNNALFSGMPYLGSWIFTLASGIIGDKLLQYTSMEVGLLRKLAQTLAHIGPGLCLFSLTFIECDKISTLILLFITVAFQGISCVGYVANAVDIAPNFAGTIMGIVGTLYSIPGFLAPITVGILTQGQQTFEQWNKVFYMTFGIYCFDILFFLVFGSGEEQPWNQVINTEKDGLNLAEKLNTVDETEDQSS